MTSRSPNIDDKDKENVDDQSMKHSQISIKNENQKGLKFNPNKKGRKHLE